MHRPLVVQATFALQAKLLAQRTSALLAPFLLVAQRPKMIAAYVMRDTARQREVYPVLQIHVQLAIGVRQVRYLPLGQHAPLGPTALRVQGQGHNFSAH